MEQNNNEKIPFRKIFISYSWSSNDYVDKVRELAEELANNAMEVELDQWSLKEGDDKFIYMEQMVNDSTIDKVIILLDKKYKEKADEREGGVGTETTIMTPKIYADVVEKRGKQKFIPVVMERNVETGKEFVPAFLDGRKYIDLTDADHYSEKFEELVRAIHDKPIFRKPLPGKAPSYLLEDEGVNLGTTGRSRRAIEFLTNDKTQALNAVKDYFALVIENLRMFDFPSETNQMFDEEVVGKIQELTPLRDEIVDVFLAINKYREDSAIYEEIHNFFEQLLPYFEYRKDGDSNHQWAADHYKFFGYELFLYAVATLVKFKRFEQLNELTESKYYFSGSPFSRNQNTLLSFTKFNTYSEALRDYNQRQSRQAYSIEASFIHKRATRSDIRFENLMEADFLLFLIYKIDDKENTYGFWNSWYPVTQAFAEYRNNPFEIFLRSQSRKFFNKFKTCLRNSSKEELSLLINGIEEKMKREGRGNRVCA
ncbi:MAG: SEFIR domain-containing protein [Acidobacteriota bacterium]